MDYDSLASQYGGTAAAAKPAGTDYDSLAASMGGTPSGATAAPSTGIQKSGTPNPEDQNNWAQNMIMDPLKTLIVKPAVRMVQGAASAAGGMIGGDFGNRLQESANQPMDISVPILGNMRVEPQKDFGQGGATQIAGDALKSASYLVPGGEAADAGTAAARGTSGIFDTMLEGAKVGTIQGGLSGAGNALQQDNADFGSVLKGGLGGMFTGALGGMTIGGAFGAGAKAFDAATSKIGPAATDIFRPGSTDESILNTYNKAVKPSVAGKGTMAKSDAYDANVLGAIKTIADNKANLQFDTNGVAEKGRLPQSLSEFADAVAQTKKSIYDEYSAISQRAGEQGAKIDMRPIAAELNGVIENKALGISNPEAVQYAEKLKERIGAAGTIDAKTAEDVIQNYNASLKAFYRNPTYDSASKAAIDAGVANNMRRTLDEIIQNTTGEQYSAVKAKYGALKAIEADVQKRSIVNARKNEYGLLDYTNIFSGGDIASGLLTLNPAQFAKGVAEFGIKSFIKAQNNPDRAITKLFENVEKSQAKGSAGQPPTPFSFAPVPKNGDYPVINQTGMEEYTPPDKMPTIELGSTPTSKFKTPQGGVPQVKASEMGAPKVYAPEIKPGSEPYISPDKMPTIELGPTPRSKFSRADKNLPTIEGKAGMGALLGTAALGAGVTAASTPSTSTYQRPPEPEPTIDMDAFKKAVAQNETSVVKGDKAAYLHKNADGTKDIGMYGINDQTLKTYGKKYLGKSVSLAELRKSPELQDKFIEGYIDDMNEQGVTDPKELLALWHYGWSKPEKVADIMKVPRVKKYVDNGTTTYGGK